MVNGGSLGPTGNLGAPL